jgi:hypothetical protein
MPHACDKHIHSKELLQLDDKNAKIAATHKKNAATHQVAAFFLKI